MATLYYAEHVHIAQTQIPTPYFCSGQEYESESKPKCISGNINEPSRSNPYQLFVNRFPPNYFQTYFFGNARGLLAALCDFSRVSNNWECLTKQMSSRFLLRSVDSSTCYRPQTKFAKVMFSQVFVCPQGGSLSRRGSLSRGRVCLGGSLSEGSLCQGRFSVGGSVRGVSLSRRSLSGRPPYDNV